MSVSAENDDGIIHMPPAEEGDVTKYEVSPENKKQGDDVAKGALVGMADHESEGVPPISGEEQIAYIKMARERVLRWSIKTATEKAAAEKAAKERQVALRHADIR